jgi:hypothetical protein
MEPKIKTDEKKGTCPAFDACSGKKVPPEKRRDVSQKFILISGRVSLDIFLVLLKFRRS